MANPPPGINDDPTDDTPFEALSDKSLKTAGYAYLVGDAALYVSGLLSGKKNEGYAGAWWLAGGLAAARYGNPSSEKQLQLLERRLSHYLRKQNVKIPNTPDTATLAQTDGVINTIESFFYTYPSQLLNTAYLIGGGLLARSGQQHKNSWDIASGSLVIAGALAGLLIPEKKPDPEHPPEGILQKAVSWIQEKPLRLSAGFFLATDYSLIRGALQEQRTQPQHKGYMFKYLTAASYIFGNVMLALSSKNLNGSEEENKKAMEKLADAAAHVIAAQPRPMQEALLQQISEYLTTQHECNFTTNEIVVLLQNKINKIEKFLPNINQWKERVEQSLQSTTSPGCLL